MFKNLIDRFDGGETKNKISNICDTEWNQDIKDFRVLLSTSMELIVTLCS